MYNPEFDKSYYHFIHLIGSILSLVKFDLLPLNQGNIKRTVRTVIFQSCFMILTLQENEKGSFNKNNS